MFLLSKVSSKQIFSLNGLTILSDRRLWNPYNFSRLLGYRSDLITVVKLGSVLKQLQVALSLLFTVFARGGIAWFYNIFNKLQGFTFNPKKRSEVLSRKPRPIKPGLQIFNWHPGSLSNHKYLVFHTKRKIKELLATEPSFMVNARRIDYRSNNFMRSLSFKRRFRRPYWQRRNRFWRPKRLSRVKFLDVRRLFLRLKKNFKRVSIFLKNSKKVSAKRFKSRFHDNLSIIDNYFIHTYGPLVKENLDTNLSISNFDINPTNRVRSIFAYISHTKPEVTIPEIETIKPGTPDQPNVLPVDNMPTGSLRRIRKKKRKLEKKLFDPFHTEIAEDFFLLKDLFFSNLSYREKRWFSFSPFVALPPKRYRSTFNFLLELKFLRSASIKHLFSKRIARSYHYYFFKSTGRKISWHEFKKRQAIFKKKIKKGLVSKIKRSPRSYYYRRIVRNTSMYVENLMCIAARLSRYVYRSRDFVFGSLYARFFRCHFRQRALSYFHSNINENVNPYYNLPFNDLSIFTLKKIPNFNLKFDYVNEIRFLRRYHKIKYFKKRKLKANTLTRMPGIFNFSLKKKSSLASLTNFFNCIKPSINLRFSKKRKHRSFEKSYLISRTPFYGKNSHIKLKKYKPNFYISTRYKTKPTLNFNPKMMVKIKKRLLFNEASTYFKQFYRGKRASRVFPSILLVASLSRYALSVLNEAQCVGVSLVYFTDSTVSPLCNLFNVVMNSQINTLSSIELIINLIFGKAKVFNLISRVW
jgi:hypothetical protein